VSQLPLDAWRGLGDDFEDAHGVDVQEIEPWRPTRWDRLLQEEHVDASAVVEPDFDVLLVE